MFWGEMSCVWGEKSCVLLDFLTKGATLWIEGGLLVVIPSFPALTRVLLKFLTNSPQNELQLDIFLSSTPLIYYYI